jgi:hypothetical protein
MVGDATSTLLYISVLQVIDILIASNRGALQEITKDRLKLSIQPHHKK